MPRDLLNPSLTNDRRVAAGAPALQRVFANDLYEVFVALYPSGLLGVLVHYKREELRIMSPLGETSDPGPGWAQAAVERLKSGGRGPFHWIMDSKLACGIQLTLHDRASLKMAGVVVPKSAGRFKDLFGDKQTP